MSLHDKGPGERDDAAVVVDFPSQSAKTKYTWRAAVLADKNVPRHVFNVAYFISERANASLKMWWNQSTISRHVKLTTRSVRDHIGTLIKADYLTKSYEGGRRGNTYTLAWPNEVGEATMPRHPHDEGAISSAEADFLTTPEVTGSLMEEDRQSASAQTGNALPPEYVNESTKNSLVVKVQSPRGCRWPSDAIVPEEWRAEAVAMRERHGLPPVDVDLEAEKFANYWSAQSGAKALKIDWRRTWIVWILNSKGNAYDNATRGSAHERFLEGSKLALLELERQRGG